MIGSTTCILSMGI